MRKKPLEIVFLYLAVSVIWILGSDHLVQMIASAVEIKETELQTGKGLFFVLVTAALLYLAIKKQQTFLYKSEKQYKNLFYSNPNPLWIYDLETLKFLEVNDSAIRLYGYSKEEFKGMSILDIRPREDSEKAMAFAKTRVKLFRVSENCTHLKKNTEAIRVYITSNEIEFNGRNCVLVMAQDVTLKIEQGEKLKLSFAAEKQLKEELENHIVLIRKSLEEKRRLAEVVDRINNIVIITDPQAVIIWVNQAFVEFTGYTFQEAVGNRTNFLHGPKTNLGTQKDIIKSLAKNEYPLFEILNYTKAGEEYWVELNISPIYAENKKIERYISVQNIITERKERECKILNYNKDLRTLAWTNSHALRKPIASILSLVLLSKEMKTVEEIQEIHSHIESCSIELDEITKKIGKEINQREAENLATIS